MEKKMNKNTLIAGAVVVVLVVGGAAFFAGWKVGQGTKSNFTRGNFNGATGVQMMGRNGGARVIGQGGRLNFIDGEVVSKTDQNMTMKLTDGGSKIILLSSSTAVTKSASGSINDLTPGAKLMINGDTNADGSVTARTIQLRDANAVVPAPGVAPIR